MGIINVQTPAGDTIKVQIAGEKPTEEEQKIILDNVARMQFSSTPQTSVPVSPDIDIGESSLEEIQEYARQRRAMGLDPITGEQLTEEEFIRTYKDPTVDYESGLDSVSGFSRFTFGSLETAEEKSNYLKGVVGEDGFRTDDLGRLILTSEGREVLGLGKGKDIAIDEEGLTFNDVKEFAGATAFPLTATIGVGLAASGVGFIPGMLLVGASAFGAKLLDEGIEYARGLQRQSVSDVMRDAAYEGAFSIFGDGVGRAISNLIGFGIKGSRGMTKASLEQNEALRKSGLELVNREFRPTIAGATDEAFRPVLNRFQAIAEGVYPNRAAALQNLNQAVKELQELGVGKQKVDDLFSLVSKDIDSFYESSTEAFAKAQKRFDKATKKELDKIMKSLKEGSEITPDLAERLRISKAIFDEDSSVAYNKANEALGDAAIIPMRGISAALNELDKRSIADIGAGKFAQEVRRLSKQGGGKATLQEVAALRTGLIDAQKSPQLLADTPMRQLSKLKSSIDDAIEEAYTDLSLDVVNKTATKIKGKSKQQLSDALGLWTRANEFYRNGIGRFDNIASQSIIKEAQKNRVNLNFIYQELIDKDDPETLKELFRAIRGIPVGPKGKKRKGLLGQKSRLYELSSAEKEMQKEMYGNRRLVDVRQQAKNIKRGDPNFKFRLQVEKAYRRAEKRIADKYSFRGSGVEKAEEVRQSLAKIFLRQAIEEATGVEKGVKGLNLELIDGLKLASIIKQKGKAIDVLFTPLVKGKPNQLTQLNDLIDVLKRDPSGHFPKSLINQLQEKPLGDALQELIKAKKTFFTPEESGVIKAIQSSTDPDIIAREIFNTPQNVRLAERVLNPRTMEQVRNAGMGRILRQIGGAVDDAGVMKITDDFASSFKTGKIGSRLQGVLDDYDPKTINAMFNNPTAYESLSTLAEQMVKVSDKPLAGKGGLAAPTIALGLTIAAFLVNPLAALGPAAGYLFMSKALRDPRVLRMMLASRRQNTLKDFLNGKMVSGDPIGQGFQAIWQIAGSAGYFGTRLGLTQSAEEALPVAQQVTKESRLPIQIPSVSQDDEQKTPDVSGILSNITGPAAASSVSRVNPITVPNPVDRLIAERGG